MIFQTILRLLVAYAFQISELGQADTGRIVTRITEERIKLLAACFNIAAAGSFVGASLTEPLAYVTTGKVDLLTMTNFMLISAGGAIILHLIAQSILGLLE